MVKRVIRSAPNPVGAALAIALSATLATTAHAQSTLITESLQERAARTLITSARSLNESYEEARAQLTEAQELRNSQSRLSRKPNPKGYKFDKSHLFDWIVCFQNEKVKLLEELVALRNIERTQVDPTSTINTLNEDPPYSVLQVDALRDEVDNLKKKLAMAEASLHVNLNELQNLRAESKTRWTELRQAGAKNLAARSPTDIAKSVDELEKLTLLKRIEQIEVEVVKLDQERLKLQIALWRNRIGILQSAITRSLPNHKLSPNDLAAQQQLLRLGNEKLVLEIESIFHQAAKRRAEQETIGLKGRGNNETRGRINTLLDLSLKTDSVILKSLKQLQVLNNVIGNAWGYRYILLSSNDPEQRRSASTALDGMVRKLADWRNYYRARQEARQIEISTQQIHIENLSGDSRDKGTEKEILDLLLRQKAMDERVELTAARAEDQISRWLADSAYTGNRGYLEKLRSIRDRAEGVLMAVLSRLQFQLW